MGRRKPKGASTELPKLDELKLDGLLVPPSAQPKVTQEMVDGICNILWHNHQTWPITSAVVEVSRYLYTTGGSFSTIGGMLKEWDKKFWANRKEELDDPDEKFEAALEVLEILPDGEIPEPLEVMMRKVFHQLWKVAVREASTTPLSGQAAKMEQELQVLRQQAADYPRLQMELEIVKQTNERVIKELSATAQLVDKQKLADSESLQQRNEHLNQQFLAEREKSDRLEQELVELREKAIEIESVESQVAQVESKFAQEIMKLEAKLKAKNEQITELQTDNKELTGQVGQQQALQEQVERLQKELNEANGAIAQLQSKRNNSKEITVDAA